MDTLFVPDLSYKSAKIKCVKGKAGKVTEFDGWVRLSNCGFQQEANSMWFKVWKSLHTRV